jgi:hypothetical protein
MDSYDLTMWDARSDPPRSVDRIRWKAGEPEPRYDTGRASNIVEVTRQRHEGDLAATLRALTGWSNAYVTFHLTKESP